MDTDIINSYYQFKDEATDVLKPQLIEQILKANFQQLKNNFGDIQSLEYAGTWIQKDNDA